MRYGSEYGSYSLSPMPGSAQIAIVHNVYVKPAMRGQRKGTEQHAKMLERAQKLGYQMLVCTVRDGNAGYKRVLSRGGWVLASTMRSHATGEIVGMYTKVMSSAFATPADILARARA
jgi:RimJ/RimL family protein N-acetyltransferase